MHERGHCKSQWLSWLRTVRDWLHCPLCRMRHERSIRLDKRQ
ncbi:hypothetical protein QQ055_00080 [Geitlerinema calcuttense NRMC-F 0142]|uniref:Uncharacterized protein n=1 Tax=Geitlerinema calcuttense NRMC-F 0142 TaxID=2922238 RepID=A0ABT7LV25_9CYAN|nr:hypothetical protein [Geitlerinema calcuttense NRMC-F 0142]